MGLQRVGLLHNGTTAGWAGAQWDYSGLGWCIMGLQRVGLVHSGTTAGWVGAQWDYSGLGWCIMGLQRGWAGA